MVCDSLHYTVDVSAMKVDGGVDVYLHSLTLALDGGQWLA